MASPKSCAILGHNPMRFAWGFDEEAAECHDIILLVIAFLVSPLGLPMLAVKMLGGLQSVNGSLKGFIHN